MVETLVCSCKDTTSMCSYKTLTVKLDGIKPVTPWRATGKVNMLLHTQEHDTHKHRLYIDI